MKPLKRPVRRGLLVAHAVVSVGRLGLNVGLLAPGLTAYLTGDPASVRDTTRSMRISGDWLVILVAPFSLVNGRVPAPGTFWSLIRRGRRSRFSASSAKPVDARSSRRTA